MGKCSRGETYRIILIIVLFGTRNHNYYYFVLARTFLHLGLSVNIQCFVPNQLQVCLFKNKNKSNLGKTRQANTQVCLDWLVLLLYNWKTLFDWILLVSKPSSYSSNSKAVIFPTIKNAMNLNFPSNTALPNDTQIVNTLLRASYNTSLPFKIFPYSIVVNGTGMWLIYSTLLHLNSERRNMKLNVALSFLCNAAYSSAEVSSHTSVLTASILLVLSLLVTRFDWL